MEHLVYWNCKEKNSALPKQINEFGDVVSLEDVCAQLATIYDIVGDMSMDRLREIVDACNLIGKKVYINQWWHGGIRINNPPIEKTVYNVLISQSKGALLQFKDGAFHTSQLGKKIFTSKEAAESALAKED